MEDHGEGEGETRGPRKWERGTSGRSKELSLEMLLDIIMCVVLETEAFRC